MRLETGAMCHLYRYRFFLSKRRALAMRTHADVRCKRNSGGASPGFRVSSLVECRLKFYAGVKISHFLRNVTPA